MLEKARLRKAAGGTWCTTPAPTATALARSAAPRSTSSGTFPNPTGVRSRTIPDSSVSTGGTFCGESYKVTARRLTDEAKVEPIGTATSPQRRRERRGSAEKANANWRGRAGSECGVGAGAGEWSARRKKSPGRMKPANLKGKYDEGSAGPYVADAGGARPQPERRRAISLAY